jgi:hypothetical protein
VTTELHLADIPEIAKRLGVVRRTVSAWRYRHQRHPRPPWRPFPQPTMTVSGRPVWRWADVEAWAKATGRLI